jgi:tellurite resistance protein TerC
VTLAAKPAITIPRLSRDFYHGLLRALYFALASFMGMFHYLTYGLAVLLVFIGGKMLAHAALAYKMPVGLSLGVIGGIIAVSVIASLLKSPQQVAATPSR